jgi:hypothetical protein
MVCLFVPPMQMWIVMLTIANVLILPPCRVLLERLIVNRPHPWGLLITFIELIKNPRYSFWDHAFTRIDPDIEKLFDSVSRSVKRSA